MWRSTLLALAFLILCPFAFSQSTTVSGTITDAGAQAWFGGTYSFVFLPNPNYPGSTYTWSGGSLNKTITGQLNGSGAYSVSIPSNNAISPQGSSWSVTFCPQASSSCTTPISLSLVSPTLTVSPTPPAILINMQTAVPPISAYADSEITGTALGSQYYNLTLLQTRTCTALSGNGCSTWTSGSVSTSANLTGPGSITGIFSGNHTDTGIVTDINTSSTYAGNAGTATALAAVPTQCTAVQVATGVAASGNANCTATPTVTTLNAATVNTTNTNSTGPGTHSGPETFTGALNSNNLAAGNVANKYATASAYRYVDGSGSDSNDGLSPGTAFATPQNCNTVIIALGGGTCDAHTLYNFTITSEVDAGNSSGVPVTLLLPQHGTWSCGLTGGTAYCLKVFNKSAALGPNSGEGQPFVIQATATANVDSVCGTDPSAVTAGYSRLEGFTCTTVSGATVANAVGNIQQMADSSYFGHLTFGTNSSTASKPLFVHRMGAGARLDTIVAECNGTANCTPCTFGSATESLIGLIYHGGSCVHAGAGKNQVVIVQNNLGFQGLNYFGKIYTEIAAGSSDQTTPVVSVQAPTTPIGPDILDGVILGIDNVAGATRAIVDIASGSKLISGPIRVASPSVLSVLDHNYSPALSVNTTIQGGSIPGYFTQPFQFEALQMWEATAPSSASAIDVCYADSTAHAVKCSYNNGIFGQVPITPNLMVSVTAPTIAAAGCGGAAASIPNNNGTAAFTVNVGTTPGSACTITMPAATTGWACSAVDVTTNSTSVFYQKQSPAASQTTTQIVITNFSDVAAATAFTASDVMRVMCHAY